MSEEMHWRVFQGVFHGTKKDDWITGRRGVKMRQMKMGIRMLSEMGTFGVIRSTRRYMPAMMDANGQVMKGSDSKKVVIAPAIAPSQVFLDLGEK